ncbi:MAG: phosphoribosylformylglycinamidine cyclo-ligase [Verrucomicrobiota bacterium]
MNSVRLMSLTYKDAGVDIHEAAEIVCDIGELCQRTQKTRQLHQAFGLFAASYDLSGYESPVIVTGCDGVGTKLELLLEHDLLEAAGKDLVAMSVNDILTTGGDPLLFLDYIGIARLEPKKITRLVAGMVEYLESCGCILAGGETAEMPGIVPEDVIELSGFCIGAAEKEDLLDPSQVKLGDVVIGYASDGFHANGWSLVRRVLRENAAQFSDEEICALLAPTRLYHDVVSRLQEAEIQVRAFAHITGGGLPENLERFLSDFGAELEVPAWQLGAIPKVLEHCDKGDIANTFNLGFGWVAIVPPEQAAAALSCGPGAINLGEVDDSGKVRVNYAG